MERADLGYPSPQETLHYYLEDLTAALERLGETRPRHPMDPEFDRSFYSTGRYHYYEVLSVQHTVQDLLCAIREVEDKLRDRYGEKISPYGLEQLPGQRCLLDFKYLMCAA